MKKLPSLQFKIISKEELKRGFAPLLKKFLLSVQRK